MRRQGRRSFPRVWASLQPCPDLKELQSLGRDSIWTHWALELGRVSQEALRVVDSRFAAKHPRARETASWIQLLSWRPTFQLKASTWGRLFQGILIRVADEESAIPSPHCARVRLDVQGGSATTPREMFRIRNR